MFSGAFGGRTMTERQRLMGQYLGELYGSGIIRRGRPLPEIWQAVVACIWDDLQYVLRTVGKEAATRYAAALVDHVMGKVKP